MNARDAFIRRICEEPAEDVHRLVYADWLDENGDPERAEFIRVQVELPRLNFENECKAKRRCRELLERSLGLWFAWWGCPVIAHLQAFEKREQRGKIVDAYYSRGFVSHVTLTQADFLAHAESIFRSQPVCSVTLSDREPEDDRGFMWFGGDGDYHATVAPHIWEEIVAMVMVDWGEDYKGFETPELARAALSAACVAYGRELAGLPALVTAASRPAASRG